MIYTYSCCGKTEDYWVKLKDPVPVCEKCGKQMKKEIANTSFKLKGQGWAKDGYSGKYQ